jgi:hypothetical protein
MRAVKDFALATAKQDFWLGDMENGDKISIRPGISFFQTLSLPQTKRQSGSALQGVRICQKFDPYYMDLLDKVVKLIKINNTKLSAASFINPAGRLYL